MEHDARSCRKIVACLFLRQVPKRDVEKVQPNVSDATADTAAPLLGTDKPPEPEVIAVRQTPRVASKQEEIQSALGKAHDDVNYMHKRKCQGLLTKEECNT